MDHVVRFGNEEASPPMTALLEAPDPVAQVLQARKRFDQARAASKKYVARHRAQLGRSMRVARDAGVSQADIARAMKLSVQQVRVYEDAYTEWLRDYPDEDLYPDGDARSLQQAS